MLSSCDLCNIHTVDLLKHLDCLVHFVRPSDLGAVYFFQVGNHIDVLSKKWVAQDAGIGAGVDSYFEYLVKGSIMLQDEELLSMFLGITSLSSDHLIMW